MSAVMASVKLDMVNLAALLDQAGDLLEKLSDAADKQLPVDVDMGPKRKPNPAAAAMNHDLLHLQNVLALASAEAGTQYWRMRGRADVRYEEDNDL